MDPQIAVLELTKRVERLERANRWWSRAAMAAGLTVMALLGIAQAPSPTAMKTVRASRFVLVNHVGDEVAEFGLVDYLPALSFLDGARHPFTQLTASQIVFSTATETEIGRVKLGVEGLSIVGRKTLGTQDVPRVLLDTTFGPSLRMRGDSPTVELTDVNNHAVRLNTLPSVELSDNVGKSKAVLGRILRPYPQSGDVHLISDTGVGSLSLIDEKGAPRLQLAGGTHPNLLIFDEQGGYRMQVGRTLPFISEAPDRPYTATILDESRGVRWQAPAR